MSEDRTKTEAAGVALAIETERPARPGLTRRAFFSVACVAVAAAGGCGGVTLIPNSDPGLRRTRTQFSEDAAMRHPFKDDAPSGGAANGRAMVDYGADTLQVVNLSPEDWYDVEIWVNRRYVVFVPKISGNAPKTTTINFKMLYDEKGNAFHTDSRSEENRIHQLEMFRENKMYTLKLDLADYIEEGGGKGDNV